MNVDLYEGTFPDIPEQSMYIVRVEVPIVSSTEEQFKIILLDADDSFDIIVHYPTGEREAVWSLVKDDGTVRHNDYLTEDDDGEEVDDND